MVAVRQASDGKFGDILNLEAVDALRNFYCLLEQGQD
jgi:hypothetical protein